MSLKTKRKLDQAENNLFNKLKQGISQHNYQLPKSGTKGVTGSRGGSMYSNVKNGASLYDSPESIINNGDPFGVTQGLYSDEGGSGRTFDGINIGDSFKPRERGSGEGRSEEVTITKKGAGAPGGNDATDNKKEGELDKRPNIIKKSGNGNQVLVEDTGNNVDEALGNITNKTNTDPDAGRFLKGVRTENGGRLADGYLDLGNGFKQAQALVKNIKANQQSKSDPLSSNFKPGKLKRQTRRFIKQGVKSNEEFGNDDYRTNLDGLKPIDDANYNPKEGQRGMKPIPRGYMPKNMSNQQEKQNQKITKIASNLTNTSTPRSNNFSGQTNDEFNKSQMPEFKKLDDNYSGQGFDVDGMIKKETKRKNLNDQIKASKTDIEKKNANDKANKKATNLDIPREESFSSKDVSLTYKGKPAKKKNTPNPKGAFNGGMLPGSGTIVKEKTNKAESRKSSAGNIKANTTVPKLRTLEPSNVNSSGSRDKASASNPESVSKQSRKNYLTSGINPNKKNTTVNKKPGGKNITPVNNNKNKNTKKVKPRKVNPTVNNKFNLEDELASVSSKKGL